YPTTQRGSTARRRNQPKRSPATAGDRGDLELDLVTLPGSMSRGYLWCDFGRDDSLLPHSRGPLEGPGPGALPGRPQLQELRLEPEHPRGDHPARRPIVGDQGDPRVRDLDARQPSRRDRPGAGQEPPDLPAEPGLPGAT